MTQAMKTSEAVRTDGFFYQAMSVIAELLARPEVKFVHLRKRRLRLL